MSEASPYPPIAFGSGGHTEDERAFFQERLGLYMKWIFILSGSFYVLLAALAANLTRLLMPRHLFHLAAVLVVGGVWTATRRFELRLRTLAGLDAAGLITTCLLLAALGASLALLDSSVGLGPRAGLLVGQLGCMAVVIARALIVPSTAARTFWLGVAAMTPLTTLAIWVVYRSPALPARPGSLAASELAVTAVMAGWSAVAVAISTVGSGVIFGLRTEVGKARRLGQYMLEEKIGEGGMGMVYRASHAMLRRPTAIKLLPPERAGEEAIRRFEREVQVTARLSHPSTIAVFDYGRTPAGVFYYAMEYLPGVNLQELVARDGPQPAGRVIHILEQVCGALTEAHEVGLIHRDIKPANVILCERGGIPDVAKVLDFGLVRRIATTGAEATLQTAPSNVLTGTPLYMAPEAIKGQEFIDGRSDLYALGAVGYFLLTGTPVFASGNVFEVLTQHLRETPVPPSVRSGRAVPPDLEAVVMRCLAKDPADRFATARDLGQALRACSRTSPWPLEEASAWWERNQPSREREPRAEAPIAGQPQVPVEIAERDRVRGT